MRAAIIARGIGHESAASHGCDLVIGINHAAAMYPCDWFCACDYTTPEIVGPLIGTPRWFTMLESVILRRRRGLYVPANVFSWEEIAAPDAASRVMFSSVWAVVLAKFIGASEIIGYGLYTLNFPEPVDGEANRWAVERRVWNETLAALGVKVCRAS